VATIGMFESLDDMIADSIAMLRRHEPAGGYFGGFSGGKDSITVKALAKMAGVSVRWHYSPTPDPPELIRFVRDHHADVTRLRPKRGSFFRRVAEKGFPSPRLQTRWCCAEFKEHKAPKGARVLLGVRREESPRRAMAWRSGIAEHHATGTTVVLPVLQWSSDDVWRFIRGHGIAYPALYDEGWHRLGCVGCPFANKHTRRREFGRWPKYERAWRRAFDRLWARRAGTRQRNGREWLGSACFVSVDAMWDWWMADLPLPVSDDGTQGRLFSAPSAEEDTPDAD